jgi:enamine deaminase RidA (YjgF/YER057c/UK114 family)
MSGWEQRIADLGLELREPLAPIGRYASAVVHERTVHTSGIVALEGPPWHLAYPGRLGETLTVDDGVASAASAMVSLLSNVRGVLGSLDDIERFVKVVGYVSAVPAFDKVPAVVDGATGILADVFGVDLLPARTSLAVPSLPGGASVELEAIIALRP